MKTFPIINDTDLIVETPFYKWLQAEHNAGNDISHFVPTIKRYTGNNEAPFKGRTDGQAHKSTFQVFWRSVLPSYGTTKN